MKYFATALLGATAYASSGVNQLLAQIQATAEAEAGDCKSCGKCACKWDWLVSGVGWDEHQHEACGEVGVEHLNTVDKVFNEGEEARTMLDFADECCAPKIQTILNVLMCREKKLVEEYDEIINVVTDEINDSVPAGDQGDQGPKGYAGAKGPRGEAGDTGPKGEQGPKGVTGVAGALGQAGPLGNQGPDGNQGPTGRRGDTGDVGERGPRGEQGNPGEQGTQGPNGDGGAEGIRGATGETGDSGATGPAGVDGPQGPRGFIGLPGADGIRGVKGDSGREVILNCPEAQD